MMPPCRALCLLATLIARWNGRHIHNNAAMIITLPLRCITLMSFDPHVFRYAIFPLFAAAFHTLRCDYYVTPLLTSPFRFAPLCHAAFFEMILPCCLRYDADARISAPCATRCHVSMLHFASRCFDDDARLDARRYATPPFFSPLISAYVSFFFSLLLMPRADMPRQRAFAAAATMRADTLFFTTPCCYADTLICRYCFITPLSADIDDAAYADTLLMP